jgi:hypothetical protein
LLNACNGVEAAHLQSLEVIMHGISLFYNWRISYTQIGTLHSQHLVCKNFLRGRMKRIFTMILFFLQNACILERKAVYSDVTLANICIKARMNISSATAS